MADSDPKGAFADFPGEKLFKGVQVSVGGNVVQNLRWCKKCGKLAETTGNGAVCDVCRWKSILKRLR